MDSDYLQSADLESLFREPCCPTGASWSNYHNRLELQGLVRQREQGWEKNLLRVAFGPCESIEVHSSLSVVEAQRAVTRALQTWNAAGLPIRFDVSSTTFDADILVAWLFTDSDPDGGLTPWTQAHADFPPGNSLYGQPPLPLHFNADFLWGIETPGRYDVETIALHELGHCLGLVYHSGRQSVMYDAIREAPLFVMHQLDEETIARVRALY